MLRIKHSSVTTKAMVQSPWLPSKILKRETSAAAMATSEQQQARGVMEHIEKMSLEHIRQVKEQVDSEVSLLQDSIANIRTAASRFEAASKAVNNLSLHPPGKNLLVPLTASLYVPGTLTNVDKLLIDVGTGYYVEKTMDSAKDYCERKINFLRANHDKLMEVAAEKSNIADQVTMVMQAKFKQSLVSK